MKPITIPVKYDDIATVRGFCDPEGNEQLELELGDKEISFTAYLTRDQWEILKTLGDRAFAGLEAAGDGQ